MGSSSKKVTIGYRYRMGLHLIFSHGPVDKVTKIECENAVVWTGTSTGGDIVVNQEDLFGGDEKEGGLQGTINVQMGGLTQGRNSYLQSLLGADIPAYRGVFGFVLRKFYIGTQKYLKRLTVWASRIHIRDNGSPQWYDEKAEVLGDMNPAHIIRESLTDQDWGMGYPEVDMDEASFVASADKLHAEGMGMSLLWDKGVSLEDFIGQILKHIDGSLYVDRVTGKFVLKLARGDYDSDNLLTLDQDSIVKVNDYKRNTVGELTNAVTVIYWDYNSGKNGSVTVQDIALVANQGSTNGTTVQYPGFTRAELANRVATRDLRVMTTPLATATIYATRKASGLNIGDVFAMSWPNLGVERVVMRVLNVELGSLESNQVKLSVIEDVFDLGSAVYATPPPTEWSDPVSAPLPSPYNAAYEAPFWELVQRMGEPAARALAATSGFALLAAARPTSDAIDARLMTNPTNTAYTQVGMMDFCPIAILDGVVTRTQTVLPIKSGVDLDLVDLNTYLRLDGELMSVLALTSTTVTVGRGVLDTVPAEHYPNSVLYFNDEFGAGDNTEYVLGEITRYKSLTVTGKGVLDLASAPQQSVTIAGRAAKPYPPGNVKINAAYPAEIIEGSVVLSWAHRDRLQQTGSLVPHTAGSIGPETGVTYSATLKRVDTGAVVASFSGVTGTTETLAPNQTGELTLELWSVRDGLTSWQKYTHTFTKVTSLLHTEAAEQLTTETAEVLITET